MYVAKCIFLNLLLIYLCQNSYAQNIKNNDIFYIYEGGISGIDTIKINVTKYNIQKDLKFELCFDRYSFKDDKSNNRCYVFSTENEIDHVKFISKKEVFLNNTPYSVYKFLYDDPNIQDEEEMYFYSPQVGILIRRNLAWGGYERIFLIKNSIEKTQIAFLLADKILIDSNFFNNWQE